MNSHGDEANVKTNGIYSGTDAKKGANRESRPFSRYQNIITKIQNTY